MILSSSHFNPDLPYWQDYLPFLRQLTGVDFPSCAQLNELLPDGLRSKGGHTIRFVDSDLLTEDNYEHRIYTTGQVSTRAASWHDLFNAMVWMRFPQIKTAMNALHYSAGAKHKSGSRGKLRDALTLFDECGVIVFSDQANQLDKLIKRHWSEAFQKDEFSSNVGISICGHAILEKYLASYKAMTAKALYIQVSPEFMQMTRQDMLEQIDRQLAQKMLNGEILSKPACLSPLPLAGIPGWWPQDEQTEPRFYEDLNVFRPAPAKPEWATILNLY